MTENEKELSLYVHIPFCVRKCAYCDFLSAAASEEEKEAYVGALLAQIESYRQTELAGRKIKSVFIGGGTPSVLSGDQMRSVIEKIKSVFNNWGEACEVSMEMNPGTVTKEKCMLYVRLGVNRLSIGLQSPDEKLLKKLGRVHTYRQFMDAYEWADMAGISNINVDLMASLPGQSVEAYCAGLQKIAMLSPAHISAYSLILEEGTPFYETYAAHPELLPDEEADRQMYVSTKEILQTYGYSRYEISNYAKPGFACRHNIVYWQRGDYLGLGLGSASLVDGVRLRNMSDLRQYTKEWMQYGKEPSLKAETDRFEERHVLSKEEQMEESMFLGLRMMEGISCERFAAQFGALVYDIYADAIESCMREGLLYAYERPAGSVDAAPGSTEHMLALTDRGIDVSNYVFEKFLL